MFLGILLLLIGILMFLDRVGLIHIHFGEYIVPVALIALGVSFIAGSKKKRG
ncbi:MAG: hypothetical protein JSW34_13375 [Candidatus Zixiibacteriota bacterium]|nr:MAG: hypothetical protein JSW34_13375 [candidate division Zixibacteria bacterium]